MLADVAGRMVWGAGFSPWYINFKCDISYCFTMTLKRKEVVLEGLEGSEQHEYVITSIYSTLWSRTQQLCYNGGWPLQYNTKWIKAYYHSSMGLSQKFMISIRSFYDIYKVKPFQSWETAETIQLNHEFRFFSEPLRMWNLSTWILKFHTFL